MYLQNVNTCFHLKIEIELLKYRFRIGLETLVVYTVNYGSYINYLVIFYKLTRKGLT